MILPLSTSTDSEKVRTILLVVATAVVANVVARVVAVVAVVVAVDAGVVFFVRVFRNGFFDRTGSTFCSAISRIAALNTLAQISARF